MEKKSLTPSAARDRQNKIDAAMPDVKNLVRLHSRLIVQYCVKQLGEYEKKVLYLKKIKAEAAQLEKEIG
jgi:hypothetical protein